MVGIVVVSHSEPLAQAAVELATQMVGDDPPPIEVAAGSDGGLGTDAVAVAAAIERADRASQGAGVLVISDLGSALLSSEMALEFVEGLQGDVLLSRAPFVEGLVVAVVQAAIGKSLADVESEAVGALKAKSAQLGPEPLTAPATAVEESGSGAPSSSGSTLDVEVVNPQGVHARPAALLAKTAAALPVEVSITNLETGQGPAAADSMLELMTIGARQGHRVRLAAEGPGAMEALTTIAELFASGLGEGSGSETPPPA